MDKILFLDIDGVLNHDTWFNSIAYKSHEQSWKVSMFDPECVKRVNTILEKTGAKLVISSSWRGMEDLKDIFAGVGLPTEFDKTPYASIVYNLDPFDRDNDSPLWWRGSEIKWYLEHNYPNAKYCILDDDVDMLDEQLPYFVNTVGDSIYQAALYKENEGSGLTEKCMNKVIKILNDEL